MSGKFLARASALSLAVILAACGGDDDSTPLVDTGNNPPPIADEDGSTSGSNDDNASEGGSGTGENDSTILPTLSITATPAEVIAGNSSRITVSAVDANGEKVTELADQIVLNSICANSTDDGAAATFETNQLSISEGTVFTNYTPTAACIGTDTISARWNSDDSAKAEVNVNVLAEQTPALALGTMSAGGAFQEGVMEALDTLPLDNDNNNLTRLRVVLYDTANQRVVEGSENKVNFYSTCLNSEWASFEPESITPETGVAETLYSLGEKKLCTGSDTIYARLGEDYSIKAKVTVPIADTGTAEPDFKIGKLDSNGFEEGKISADPAELKFVTGQPAPTTELSFAIVDNNGELSTQSHTYAFSSMCLDAGRASIKDTSNSTSSGEGIATYVASESCMKNDTVSVIVDGDNRLRASIELFASEQPLVLGSLDAMGAFSPGVLSIANNQLGYNSNQQTETDIYTAIAYEDGSGGYTVVRGDVVGLELFSTCTESGRSLIETTGTTETGELISKYTANECVGNDVIYGRIQGSNDLASGSVSIAPKEGQNLALGYFDAGTFNSGVIGNTRSTALPLGVQTKLYLSIADAQTEERIKGQPLTVEFFSQCDDQDGASPFSTNSASVNMGYIEILYTAQSCSELLDEDRIRAELKGVEGVSATAKTTITLLDLDANSLTASLPKPNSIAPSWYSTEGRETTSVLKVRLEDNQENGLSGEEITFSLDNPGLDDVAELEPVDNGKTNADGFAEVKIKALEPHDNVVFRVIARYTDAGGNILEAYSAPIAVNSKLPFEEKFSISTTNFAPDTRGVNGVQVPLTLLAADNEGNRIRGNTAVNFETDIGSIDPECILDDEGRCTVTWESLNITTAAGPEYAEIRAYTHGTLSPADPNNPPTSTGEIETSVRMLMTTSSGIQVELDSQVIPPTGGAFCAEAFVDLDANGTSRYSPPVGTTMEFEATNASLIPASSSSFTLGSSSALLQTPYSFTGCTFVEPDPSSTEPMKLTVTVTPPDGTSAFDIANE